MREGPMSEGPTSTAWEERLARWSEELAMLRELDEAAWVPLGVAEAETGVARSTLRSWYRSGQVPSRLVDGPNGPQRLVRLDAVVERASRSPRIQRRSERALGLEAQLALLQARVDVLEARLAALERSPGQAEAPGGSGPT